DVWSEAMVLAKSHIRPRLVLSDHERIVFEPPPRDPQLTQKRMPRPAVDLLRLLCNQHADQPVVVAVGKADAELDLAALHRFEHGPPGRHVKADLDARIELVERVEDAAELRQQIEVRDYPQRHGSSRVG